MGLKQSKIIKMILTYFAVAVLLIFLFIPYLWMVSGSFKTTFEIQSVDVTVPEKAPSYIPNNPTFENYMTVNDVVPILDYFGNSLIISIGTMILTTFVSVLAGYALSRYNFGWKKAYNLGLLSTQMFPGVAFLIPYFILFSQIYKTFGIPMKNTYWGMILTYASFSLPFSILMIKNYIDAVPYDLDEQAKIDGASTLEIIFKVIFPVSLPGIVTIAIYSFLMSWNEILFATVLTGSDTKTVSLGLLEFLTAQEDKWGGMMAACIIVSIPVLIFFTFLQKYIVQGMTSGAVK